MLEKNNTSESGQQATPEALFARAVILSRMGNVAEAEAICRGLLVSHPQNTDVLMLLGLIGTQRNNLEEAVTFFEKVIANNPNHPTTYYHLGNAMNLLGRCESAIHNYDKAITISPSNADAYHNRAVALLRLKHFNEALESCDKAISINPNSASAYNTRATILQNQKRYLEALDSCNKAIAINPQYANAYNSLGLALDKLRRYSEAVESYDKAIIINPKFFEAYTNRGSALSALRRFDEVLINHDKAIAINPVYADAYWNKALLKLLLGDYEEGWKLYEWRWKKDNIDKSRILGKPVWLGQESLAGKTILLQAEQGLGDTIQFCRYVPAVKALGGNVLLEVQPSLAELVAASMPSAHVIARGNPLPEFDCFCPLMSLPLAFKTTLNTIPLDVPYLRTDPILQKEWQVRLGIKSRPRIGLAWSGSATHANDENRSIPLNQLISLLSMNADFYSLQKDVRPDDQEILTNSTILSVMDNVKNFSDTAALISEMDLVISVDTSVVHLAGALGKPVWILLPYVPDFRWLLDKEDSPWYPTARLFRQYKIADWEYAITKIKKELFAHFLK